MWPEPVERVASALRAGAVNATIEECPAQTLSAEQAAEALGCELREVLKSIVFVCDDSVVVALVPGDRRADEAKVAALVEAGSARIAYAREVVAATGFEPGSVAPFRLPAVDAVVMEQTALLREKVWIGAGSPIHMAGLAPADLQRLTAARAADLIAQR